MSDQFSEKPLPPEQKECPRCCEPMPIDAERCWLCLEPFPETPAMKAARFRRRTKVGKYDKSLDDAIGAFIDKVGGGTLIFIGSLVAIVLAFEEPIVLVTLVALAVVGVMPILFGLMISLDAKKSMNHRPSRRARPKSLKEWQRNAILAIVGALIFIVAVWAAFVTACTGPQH